MPNYEIPNDEMPNDKRMTKHEGRKRMQGRSVRIPRRRFLAAGAAAAGQAVCWAARPSGDANSSAAVAAETTPDRPALIAMTMDLEMSMHYPQWGLTEWNYEKGNLTEPVKQYVVEACRRVKAKGGVVQLFVLGRVLEQENVDWLKEVVRAGHPVGNHTYDHVNVWAARPDELQHRFTRAPWLIHGKSVPEVIRENILMTDRAMQTRIGVHPVGFRTPGGSTQGLRGREDLQKLLLDLGFTWVSSLAAHVPVSPENPTSADFDAVVKAQSAHQPFVYPSGLVEVPMSPLGDVASFRRKDKKWKLADFLTMIERNVRWAIDHRATIDLLTHPSIMVVEDPDCRAYELICDLVNQSGGRAVITGLDALAARAKT
jgi:peptidoglycan/xylan/chitin deacetylase (PgdA/CDA1 family)